MFRLDRTLRPFGIYASLHHGEKRGTVSTQSSVTPATVVFSNESPNLIDGTENFVTFSSRGLIAGAAGNGYRVTLYSNKSSLWKTVLWQADGTKVLEKTTTGSLSSHVVDVNTHFVNYLTAVVTGTVPDTVTYSAGTGFGGSVPMSGGVG